MFQAPGTDALGSLLLGGFLKVLGLAVAQVLPLWRWFGSVCLSHRSSFIGVLWSLCALEQGQPGVFPAPSLAVLLSIPLPRGG